MRKFFVLQTLLVAALTCFSQTKVTEEMDLGYPDRNALSIPKEFTYDNTPLLTMYDNTEDRNLLVYDEDINLIKTINIRQEKTFNYQLLYQDEEREVTAVNATETEQTLNVTYEQWIIQQSRVDPSFSEEKVSITKEANGDSLIIVDLTNPYVPIEQLYFNYNYFGKQYPKRYWRSKGGLMYQYTITYTVTYGDWHSVGTRTENRQETLRRIQLCNINLNYGDGRANYYFEASQTLFNDDEEFEYIIPKYELSANGSTGSSSSEPIIEPSYGEETIETHRSTIISGKSKLALVGFQVVTADGNIVSDLLFDNGFSASVYPNYAYVITIGSKTYLAFEGYMNDKRCTVFYAIDRNGTNKIKKVNAAPARMMVSPTIAHRTEQITVTLDEKNDTHEIFVVNSAGQIVKRVPVAAGQKTVSFPAQSLSQGLNIVNTTDKSTANSCKIIIK